MATKKSTGSAEKKATKPAPAKAAAKKVAAKAANPATESKPTKAAASKAKAPVTPEQISHLAYQYWVERGRPHGSHHEDWVRAEKALKS